jgi:hypothetical protein
LLGLFPSHSGSKAVMLAVPVLTVVTGKEMTVVLDGRLTVAGTDTTPGADDVSVIVRLPACAAPTVAVR